MIRPEARAALIRWREVMAGAALCLLGADWVLRGHTLQPVLGAVCLLLGAVLMWLGWRRVRFPEGRNGPGLVEVAERQITYLTGQGGGAVALDALVRVEVRRGRAGLLWIFTEESGAQLLIPGDAQGAEAIFDALVPLPGLNYDQAAQAAQAPRAADAPSDSFLIWQRDKRALH